LVIEGVAASARPVEIGITVARGKLVHAGEVSVGSVTSLACVKISPGGGTSKGIVACLAAEKMVAGGEPRTGIA
jgi:hypothetical protein